MAVAEGYRVGNEPSGEGRKKCKINVPLGPPFRVPLCPIANPGVVSTNFRTFRRPPRYSCRSYWPASRASSRESDEKKLARNLSPRFSLRREPRAKFLHYANDPLSYHENYGTKCRLYRWPVDPFIVTIIISSFVA